METLFIVDQEFDLILLESLCFNKKTNKKTHVVYYMIENIF